MISTRFPNILVIGKTGQVGWELSRTLAPLAQVQSIDYPEIDFCNGDSIRDHIRQNRPGVIINAAAYTAVDRAETEEEKARLINGVAPGIMAEEARKIGALIVHYSTDYVFDGTKPSAYLETDAPNPLGAYGRTKNLGDQAVISAGADYLIFRLCWVYGGRGQNFMLTMMRLARERDQLRVVSDQVGCPTWSRMIAEVTALALSRALQSCERHQLNGVYHLAASGQTSWHGFATSIVELMPQEDRKCSRVEAISTAEYPTPSKRPAFSVLNCSKLHQTFGLKLPDWQHSLRQVLEK
jgi:dTDP-4-dehydrorhamnose reductase